MGRPSKRPKTQVGVIEDSSRGVGDERSRTSSDDPASTLTLRFDANGRPLPLTEKNRERLREAVELLGVSRPEALTTVDTPFDDAFVGRVFDMLARIQALIISRTTQLAFDDLHRALSLTPDERAALREPAAVVLKRRFGRWLTAHHDEVGLFVTVLVIQVRKFEELMRLRQAAERRAGESQ